MTNDVAQLLFCSDLHFGAHHMNQAEMARAFADTIFPLIPDTDIMFINGDFFDTLVIFDNAGFDPIYDTILNLFSLCEHHQIKLRVLQGTWTHDRNQCKRFEAFYRNHKGTFDFRFVDGIELETLTVKDRDLRFFYVPDDLPYKSSDDIVAVIEEKMREKGWDTVDYGCMHGFFDFTFPKNVNPGGTIVFRENQFPFVTKMIDVGHVHQHRCSGKVISNGSFDRLNHGEEDLKGCVLVKDHPDHYTATFIENKQSAVFDTLVFDKGDDTEVLRQKVKAHLASLTTDRVIHLRCMVDSPDQYAAIKSWLKENHPTIKVVSKKKSDKDVADVMIPTSSLITPAEQRIAPTRKTIAAFIRDHIPEDYVITIDEIETYLEPPEKLG